MMASALATHLAGIRQVVIVSGDRADGDLAAVVARSYLPFTLTLNLSSDQQAALARALPFVAAMRPVGGLQAAYVCHNFTCRAPVTTEADLKRELE
jgi:uncharacterized protein YyaL (SSP411 family)